MKVEEKFLPEATSIVEDGSPSHKRTIQLRDELFEAARVACIRRPGTTASEIMSALINLTASVASNLGVSPDRMADVLRAQGDLTWHRSGKSPS